MLPSQIEPLKFLICEFLFGELGVPYSRRDKCGQPKDNFASKHVRCRMAKCQEAACGMSNCVVHSNVFSLRGAFRSCGSKMLTGSSFPSTWALNKQGSVPCSAVLRCAPLRSPTLPIRSATLRCALLKALLRSAMRYHACA